MIDIQAVETAFLDALSDHGTGLYDPTDIRIDDQKHRVRGLDQKKKDLEYQIFTDDPASGWFRDYKLGIRGTFTAKPEQQPRLTPAERKAAQQERDENRRQRQERQDALWAERAEYCRRLYKSASGDDVLTHPYAASKGWTIAPHIRRIQRIHKSEYFNDPQKTGSINDALVVPIFSIDKKLWMVQIITADGTKLFPKDCKKIGHFYPIKGRPGGLYLICEGVATGLALHAATGETVFCCLDASNLLAVDGILAEHSPDRVRVACGDNDHGNPDNPGAKKAHQTDCPTLLPQFPDGADTGHTDWDDWLRGYGTADELCAMLGNLFQPEPEEPEHDYDETPDEYLPADYPDDAPKPVDKGIFDDGVVKFLGFNNSRAYYLPHGFRQVVEMSVGQHTKLQLLGIAPKHYWEAYFPSSKRNNDGVDWDMAADSFLRRSQAKGVFNPRLIRGRGAWFDDGRSIVHAGDRLVVDGQQVGLNEIDSRFIYPMADATAVTMADPMPPSEAKRFAQICDAIQWEETIFGRLLAGWCFLAPICGAIDWRPHIWLTGGAGTGKSTVMNRVMKPVLGDNHIFAAGDSTEAGLRMRLRQDAFPVIFDEFDSEREKAAKRTEDVLALITQSSTDTGAEIIKGGAGGKDDSYKIRSMFAFASIAVNIRNEAHESRLCVMTLKKPKPGEKNSPERLQHFRRLEAMIQSTLTDEYIKRLQARAIKLIPVIRKNIKTFSEAAALSPALGGMRLGDQVGALLAGSYGLFSNGEITKEDAVKWIDAQNWGSVNTASDAGDDKTCLDLILTEPVRVEGASKVRTMSVAEMIEMSARYRGGDADIGYEHTDATLARMGIKVRDTLAGERQVVIASRHKALSRILQNTPFEVSYARTIGRIDGAQKTKTERFAAVTSKAVALPIDRVIDRQEYLV